MSLSVSSRGILQTVILTGACVGTYFGLRSLPVESCDFLHYASFINSQGVLEGCGYEESGFFDLDELRFPIVVRLQPASFLAVGKPALFKLSLHTSSGRPIRYEEIAVSHTERIHALVVDQGLSDYQHLHPMPGGGPGEYLMQLTPKSAGRYDVYLDLIPLINARRTLLHTSFEVPGESHPSSSLLSQQLTTQVDAFSFSLEPTTAEAFRPNRETVFVLNVSHADNQPVQFSPIMDAFAHVVVFAPNRKGFAHLHPLNPIIAGQDPTAPDLRFLLNLDRPGSYRVWAQVMVNGSEKMLPFNIQVEG